MDFFIYERATPSKPFLAARSNPMAVDRLLKNIFSTDG
jgi:hypothetical protein